MKSLFYFLVFICLNNEAIAQFFKGTIGKHNIYLNLDAELSDTNEFHFAYYFYESTLKNIALEGVKKGDQIILYAKHSNIEDKEEVFELQFKDNNLTGYWQNNEKKLAVNLTAIEIDLDSLKNEQFILVRDSISFHDDKELVWFTEKHSKICLFRLGNGFSKKQREYFNLYLDKKHLETATEALYCEELNTEIRIKLVSSRYLSFEEQYYFFCFGPHPDYGFTGYNFDLENTNILDSISDIYPNLNYFEAIKESYQKEFIEDKECEYFESNNWDYVTWMLTLKGIEIIPLYSHAMTPCEFPFFISYEEIEKYANKK